MLSIEARAQSKRRFAQTHRVVQNRVEHRREIAGRGIDDLQYLGGRSLLLQCLARFDNEPCVFYCDDGLVGEGSDQRHLFVGEALNAPTAERDDARRLVIAQQRYTQRRPVLSEALGIEPPVFRIGCHVLDVYDAPLQCGAAGDRGAAGLDRLVRNVVPPFCR
jgi:hypothetical protein